MQPVRTAYPAFLAVAAGFLLIAAAAHFSKDGGVADIPLAALGVASIVAYFVSLRAAVVFWMGRESVQTVRGGLREAANLIKAVEREYAAFKEAESTAAIAS